MLKILNIDKVKNKNIKEWNIREVITEPDKYTIIISNPKSNLYPYYIHIDRKPILKDAYMIWTSIDGEVQPLYIQKWAIASALDFVNTMKYFVETRIEGV